MSDTTSILRGLFIPCCICSETNPAEINTRNVGRSEDVIKADSQIPIVATLTSPSLEGIC